MRANTEVRRTHGMDLPTSHFLHDQSDTSHGPSSLQDTSTPIDEGFHEGSPTLARKLRRFAWTPKDKRAAQVEQLIPGAEDMLADKGFLPLQVGPLFVDLRTQILTRHYSIFRINLELLKPHTRRS